MLNVDNLYKLQTIMIAFIRVLYIQDTLSSRALGLKAKFSLYADFAKVACMHMKAFICMQDTFAKRA